MKLRHTAAWVGVTAIALVTTSACGADSARKAADAVDSTDVIMAALARATDRTEDVGSAQVDMTADMGTGTPVSMDGTYSWGDGFAFDVEMDTAAVQMQALQDTPTTRMLFVDGAYYYDVDPQPSGPLAGKEWMRIDASAVFGEKGAEAFSGSAGTGSPAASMRTLKFARNVSDLGEETVDGKSTVHYRAELGQKELGKFADAYTGEDNPFNSVTGAIDTIVMDIWVGEDDLPVRLKQDMGNASVTMDFKKFGATAAVTAPPAAQTGDLTEQVKEMQQG
ncbi:hypothetical protein ABZZ79_00535 [Streptomyces sp. NPDC006458]|uniref:hypothetical protein n=1 Tax=Streptomyces sp. NPDC006458 TaxID=3154302 RepID=UPI0033BBE592